MPIPEPAFSDEELLALLRDASVSPAAIAEEMEGAGVVVEPVDTLECARRLLEFPADQSDQLARLSERLRQLVLDEAVFAKAAGFVTAAAASRDKPTAKDAKRALHRLRQSGLKVEAPKTVAPVPSPASSTEELTAWMSIVDGTGERLVFHPCPVRGGIDVAQLILSDERGVASAELVPLGRRGFRKFAEKLEATQTLLVGEVPRAYSRSLIARALDRNAVSRKSIPAGFNEVSLALGPAPAPQRSPGRTLGPPAESSASDTPRALALLKLPELRTWAPPEALLRPLQLRLDEIAVSPLYIHDAQRAESARDAMRDAVSAYWTEERRQLWAERLYDAAWLLHGAGRTDDEDVALSAATALDCGAALESIAFCWAFFERVLPRTDVASPRVQHP